MNRLPALLSLVLSAFLLVGCGGGSNTDLIERIAEEKAELIARIAEEKAARIAAESELGATEAELSALRKTLGAAQDESGKLATQKTNWQVGTFAASAGAILLLLLGAALGSSASAEALRGNRSN